MNRAAQFNDRQLKQAFEWFVRLQADHCSEEERQRFNVWLAKNDSHRAAYSEADLVWIRMDTLKRIPVPAIDDARAASPRRVSLASAFVLVLSSVLVGGIWQEYYAETTHYSTRIGEHRRIELADHSVIDLNTNSQISVKISLLQRQVELTQGEALFDVSHNRLRPFAVQVGNLSIRDIGTRFNVLKHSQGTTVSVLEGEVELNDGNKVLDKHLQASNQALYRENRDLEQLKVIDSEKLPAWMEGKLVFKQTPLAVVAAELERYHTVQFNFADNNLGQETLSGTFNAVDLEPFLHALETILPVKTQRHGQQILVRRTQKN